MRKDFSISWREEGSDFRGSCFFDFLRKVGPMESYTTVFGICEDSLGTVPLNLDLNNADVGSVLITGNERSRKEDLLRSILISAARSSSEDQVRFSVITPNPGLFEDLKVLPNCSEVSSTFDNNSKRLIASLSKLAYSRNDSDIATKKIILTIHDIGSLEADCDTASRDKLNWMLKYGPEKGIWPICSIGRSIIEGRTGASLEFATVIQGFGNSHDSRITTPDQFSVEIEGQPVLFWVFDTFGG